MNSTRCLSPRLRFRALVLLAAWLPAGGAAAQLTFQVVPTTNDLTGMGAALALSENGSALSGVGWSLTNWAPRHFAGPQPQAPPSSTCPQRSLPAAGA